MSEPFVGEIRMFAGNFAPRGWALCDGQLLAVSQNEALFSLLGTIYGGDGRTTFGLPDLRGRVPIHEGSGPGLPTYRLGQKSGSEIETLSVNHMGAHAHGLKASGNPAGDTAVQGNVPAATTGAAIYSTATSDAALDAAMITPTGGGQSHTNVMPFLCVNFIIALVGIFPSRS
jgi:microcystin-dependent protein